MSSKSYQHCFVGPEPVALKAGDERMSVNGKPLQFASRVISEGNYQAIMAIVEAAGVKIDERKELKPPTSSPLSSICAKHFTAECANCQVAKSNNDERIDELELALEPLTLLTTGDMNDPLHKWFRVGQFYVAKELIERKR